MTKLKFDIYTVEYKGEILLVEAAPITFYENPDDVVDVHISRVFKKRTGAVLRLTDRAELDLQDLIMEQIEAEA